jgi:hypothetical protein
MFNGQGENAVDIVKVSIYYFSRLPLIENKSKTNKRCSGFLGVVYLIVSILTVVG